MLNIDQKTVYIFVRIKEWITKRRKDLDAVFRGDPGLTFPVYDPSRQAKLIK
jgi:hypothetical protein